MNEFQGYMRATVFAEKRATYPGWVQPKHNGVRCIDDGVTAWTREGNVHAPHTQKLLRERYGVPPKGWVRDGELVLPRHDFSFQKTQSAVAAENENSHLLQYPIFDIHNNHAGGSTFKNRMKKIEILTPTMLVESYEEVDYWYDVFLEQGYEGLIFRTDSPYIFGSAGRCLMKKKPIDSAEFIIVDVWQGKGKNVGVPTYRLARPDYPPWEPGTKATKKNTFGAVPKGTYDEKKALWLLHGDGSVVGKPYTVEFADLYDSGVPQFPIGICVRDYE